MITPRTDEAMRAYHFQTPIDERARLLQAFAGHLEVENAALKQQLADSKARVEELESALKTVEAYFRIRNLGGNADKIRKSISDLLERKIGAK